MRTPRFNLQPERTLGMHYHVVEFLGGGWEGEVYKVRERRTGIIRAAKLFYHRRGLKQAPLLKYARKLYKLRTCQIIVQYHHRDLVKIGSHQHEFLVSDFIDGEILSSFLARQKGKRLITFEALHLFYALVQGVEQIHFLGEYHGDIHSDNIMVKRNGLNFDVYLLDFFDLGRPTREKIQDDVYDLMTVLYEMIGDKIGYHRSGKTIRKIILGRKHSLISKKFKNAGQLRLYLDNLEWE